MSRKIFLIMLTTLLFLSSTATATTENIDKAEISSNYIVTPAIDTETWTVDEEMGIRTIYDTIRQGETNLHEKSVSSGLTLLVVDLNWGDSTDSLRLKVYTPSGALLGTYYDNADGQTDGRIYLYILSLTV
ncbi:peptidase domain-containing protein [Methanosarcina mazei]|nr:peptidase domain-containing protein [Methanosarcina mazei]MDO5839261.1 peptidase domain-containing protein [Methanosarcina mazei]